MTDAFVLLHTGTHTGLWSAVEVGFAVAVLAAAVGLVALMLLRPRKRTPEDRLVAAFSAVDEHEEDALSGRSRPPLDVREE